MPYRKRRPVRRQRRKVPMSSGILKRIEKMDRKLKKIDLPEMKYFYRSHPDFKFAEWNSSPTDNWAYSFPLDVPTLGPGNQDRLGDLINVHKLEIAFSLFAPISQDIPYDMTIMLYKDTFGTGPYVNQPSQGLCYDYDFVAPSAFTTGLSTRSLITVNQKKTWRILKYIKGKASYDANQFSGGTSPSTDPFGRDIKITINKPFKQQFLQGANSGSALKDLVYNSILILFKAGAESDANAGGQQIGVRSFQYRMHYTDA